MSQIGGYLTPDEHEAFKRYAAQFHLKESGLANLLLARELTLGRLPELKARDGAGLPLKDRRRITAHAPTVAVKAAFQAHSQKAGLTSNQAAAILFRAELRERWLERSVRTAVEST